MYNEKKSQETQNTRNNQRDSDDDSAVHDLQSQLASEREAVQWLGDDGHAHSNQWASVTGQHLTSHHRHLTVVTDRKTVKKIHY